MVRSIVVVLSLVACIGLSACASADPLGGTWQQTGVIGSDGIELSVPTSEAVVLELLRGEKATMEPPGLNTEGVEFTWEVDRGLLVLKDHPGWDVRTAYELEYELEGDRLETNWIDGPPRRVFERQ